MRRLIFVLPLLLVAFASPAKASPATDISIMMDDNQLVYGGDQNREFAMQRMKALGVDYVRVTVLWEVVAHNMKKAKRKQADNPKSYPKTNWDRYDGLVRSGARNGVGIYFDVTGPGPGWAHSKPPKSQKKYKREWQPKGREFFKFVKAVGTRYSGTYSDENEDGSKLPRVGFWSIYNEPNQPGWLAPQYKGKTPWSPVMYRDLWYYGRSALDVTGHKGDVVLIGETAPLGNTNTNPASPMYPKKFIREFFCIDASGNPYKGSAAKRRHCSTLKKISPLNYTAWAHHPYTKKLAPTDKDSNRDSITMANISELPALLQRAKVDKVGGAQNDLVALTEYGYETNPPDPYSGISPAKQAEYINIGDYIAYKDPNVIANTQFLLKDVPKVKKASGKAQWFTYQSGLYTADGTPKPASVAYKLPLTVLAHDGASTKFWGWLRFLPATFAAQAQIQFKPAGAADFTNVGDPATVSDNGFFETTVPKGGPGTWRAIYTNPSNGQVVSSREVETS